MRLGKALIGLALVSASCLAMLAASPAVAQDSQAMKQVGLVRTGASTFTIDVEGADVRTVVKAIAEFSGRNIVVAQDVRATVKIALRNVGWQEALRTTLRSVGLDYIDEGGILRVDESGKLAAEIAERATARA